jgi:murein DD-endopeptidase MepM/ murein hydrolase activator NlpD
LHGAIATHVKQLSDEQDRLSTMQHSAENKKSDLVSQQTELQTQQGSLSAAKDTQSTLLSKTQKQESAYQKLIALKKEQEQEFESSLNDLQTKLQVAISEADITKAGAGILQWPVDHVVITQFFGNTAFAAGGAYNGKGHNGIDLGVHIGSPIRAALSGTVLGTGNTDSISGCYSFGKWVMVKHTNGLNTMYAHLSQIRVAAGDPVSTGDLLGYSGDTGYATGPHLHFGVYVSSATKIIRLGDATQHTSACSGAVMPVVPIAGYLNPLNYLPKSR